MATGRVKWFNNAKGYGFILPDDESGDLFAHYSSIEMEGYRTLKAGQLVTFDLFDGDKGAHAVNIIPVEENIESNAATSPAEQSDVPSPNHTETV